MSMDRRAFLGAGAAAWLGIGKAEGWSGLTRAAATGARAQVDPRFEAISDLVERKMAEYRVTGVALGISKGGVRTLRGFGITNLNNPQPVTPDTVFPIASISKTVAGTAAMRLHDQGRLDVEARVTDYLTDFRIATPETARDLRVWHLMTHTPGWEGQLATPNRGTETYQRYPETLVDLPALARPGEVWSYHNSGWTLLATILEVVTEQSIHDALDDLVFDPLGLGQSTSRTGEAMSWRFAAPHVEREGRTIVRPQPFSLPGSVTAGGCAMSVENMTRYLEFHLGDGRTPDGTRLLSQASLEAMRTPRIDKNSSTDQMGLGWHLRTLEGVLTAQQGGTLAAHRLHAQLVPERDLCFSILTNHQRGDRLHEDVSTEILRVYEDLALAPNQRTGGNRGATERMHLHAEPLDPQPDFDEYLGTYRRPPVGDATVLVEDGRIVLTTTSGLRDELVFWSRDMTYLRRDGAPIEFIRDDSGAVTWIRLNGRIARREGR